MQDGKNVLGIIILAAAIMTGCGGRGTPPESSISEITGKGEAAVGAQSSEQELEEYLEGFGVAAVSPVCFYDPEGAPKLELYYDRETGRGCGLKYEETEDGTELWGFAMDGYWRDAYWNFPNPYSTNMIYDNGAHEVVDKLPDLLNDVASEYEENFEHDQEGRLCAYHLMGYVETEGRQEELLTVSFSHREDGTLQEKVYQYNEEVVPYRELGGSQYYVYDERERLLYAEFETVMGDCYFVYEDDSMVPCAYLEVDSHSHFASFVRLREKEYDNWLEVPREGAEAFLSQVGLCLQDKIYEYRRNDDGAFVKEAYTETEVTLYYDPEKELGCGYRDYPKASLRDMSGFQFKGCVEIDCREYDPYEVYAEYHTGHEQRYCLDEIDVYCQPLEELPDRYSYENAYACEYQGDRLIRILMDDACGRVERFYIYDGESGVPSYCLNLFYGCRPGVTLFKFVY